MLKPDCSQEIKTEYHMILFVAGDGPNSRIARKNLDRLCENELAGRCTLNIVDVLQNFKAAAENDILVTPTLLVCRPEPGAMVIGNLNDHQKVRTALRLEADHP